MIDQDPITKFTVAKRSEIYGTAYLDAAGSGQVFADVWALATTSRSTASRASSTGYPP
jgi:hypothetical protein